MSDILKEAISSLEKGADAVITQRSFKIIEYLANENIPVMAHLGLIPRQSSWLGGMRVVGKQYDEAKMLLDKFIDLENAGAFGVECELIPHDLMELISSKTNLVTSSLGSGNSCDIIFSFIVSYLTIKYFLIYVKNFNLNIFVYYRTFLALILFVIAYS